MAFEHFSLVYMPAGLENNTRPLKLAREPREEENLSGNRDKI